MNCNCNDNVPSIFKNDDTGAFRVGEDEYFLKINRPHGLADEIGIYKVEFKCGTLPIMTFGNGETEITFPIGINLTAELVADSADKRQGQQLDAGPQPSDARKGADRRNEQQKLINEHADNEHQDQKGGSATGMETLLLADVFDRQLKPLFVAKDALVLGTVVHKYALYLLHI